MQDSSQNFECLRKATYDECSRIIAQIDSLEQNFNRFTGRLSESRPPIDWTGNSIRTRVLRSIREKPKGVEELVKELGLNKAQIGGALCSRPLRAHIIKSREGGPLLYHWPSGGHELVEQDEKEEPLTPH